jgi:hypothetical protein
MLVAYRYAPVGGRAGAGRMAQLLSPSFNCQRAVIANVLRCSLQRSKRHVEAQEEVVMGQTLQQRSPAQVLPVQVMHVMGRPQSVTGR